VSHIHKRRAAILVACCLAACGPSITAQGETSAAECSDGRDNDADGSIDCTDLACGVHSFCAGMTPGDAGPLPSSCGASTCGGCCSGATCLGGNSASACGAAGAACLDCGPGHLCSSGGCVVDPASRWNIVVESVSVNAQTASGEAWDAFGGAPDPVVNVYVGTQTGYVGSTPAAADVFAATFDARVATDQRAEAMQTYLAFEVMDEDTSAHDRVGRCAYSGTLSDAPFTGASQTVDCERSPADDQAGFELRWHLERN